jgi:signal peptidase I
VAAFEVGVVVRRLTEESPAETEGELERPPPGEEKKRRGFFRELPGLILIAVVLALLIKTFLVQAFYIPSGSMHPTLEIGDRVLVNKLVYDFGEPQRNDIIVFEDPSSVDAEQGFFQGVLRWLTEGFGFATAAHQDFIKRVVALPGEEIRLRNGHLFIDGERTFEPDTIALDGDDFGPETVKADHVFVMGDNRSNSSDSREGLGQIPYDKIVGKAFVLLWPASRIEWLSDD